MAGRLSQDANFFQPCHISLRRPVRYTEGSLELADIQDWALKQYIRSLQQTTCRPHRAQAFQLGYAQLPKA